MADHALPSLDPPPRRQAGNLALRPRDRFLAACASQAVDRPPIWLMRQAGRALPEYRALRERHSFLELVQTPELATEVTLQPIRRFSFDGAVIFSDILVAAEALGQPYRFRDSGGIAMEFAIRGGQDVERLDASRVVERLDYLGLAVRAVRRELGDQTALLGFAGSPWTLANFMVEGGSADEFRLAKRLYYTERALFEALLEKLSDAVAQVLQLQIAAGADVVQIFDSLADLLAADVYADVSGRWIRRVIAALSPAVPVIVYVRGAPAAFAALQDSGLRAFSVDWRTDLPGLRRQLPEAIALQGNLDPALMTATPEAVTVAAQKMLTAMRGARGYIVNLGHGLPPGARLDCIEALVETVHCQA